MKLLHLNRALSAVCLLAGLSSQATPLRPADVAADPAWLLHLDCDRLRPTAVGQYLLAEMEKPGAQGKVAAFQAMFKFDLRTQLHGLTLYNTGDSPEDGVWLVYADFDRDHLATLARGANEYKSSAHNQHAIHSWIDDSKKKQNGSQPRIFASAHGNRALIFGQREASVARALDVFDRSAANLSSSKTFPALDAKTAFVQGAAQKMSFSSDPNSAIFRLSKSIRFELGEQTNRVTARLQLTAGDDDVARQIASVGEGLLSLMKLQPDRPETGKLANALSLKQDAKDVVVSLSLPAGDAIEVMKADAARRQKKSE